MSSAKNGVPSQQKSASNENDINQKKGYWHDAFAPQYLSNWALALVGIGGVIAAIFTLCSIKRQTRSIHNQAVQVRKQTRIFKESADAAWKAAEAALLNAQTLIGSERPWLLIPPKGIDPPYLVPVEENMGERATTCIFRIKNYGNTPARIFASKVELQLGDFLDAPPDPSVYGMVNAMHNVLTFPPKTATAFPAELAPLGYISQKDMEKITTADKFLWLCGFIRYQDTFEHEKIVVEYETRFCFIYETRTNAPNPFWRLAGPSEYNSTTEYKQGQT